MDELSYNGKNFSEFNTFFDGSKAFGSPEKDYELVEIMGRNGSLSIYNDRFKDILLPFPCFVRSAFLTHYRQLVEFLNSQHGYLRLETSKEPNHFRKALFQGIVEPQTTPFNHGGQFTINFLAKPQRFLKSGETPVSSQSQDEEYEGNPVTIENPSGLSSVSSVAVELSPIQTGTGDPSPSNVRPIYPANSGNLFDPNSSGTEWVTSQNAVTTIDVSKSVRVSVVQGQALTLSNDTASSNTNILLIAFLNSSNTVLSRTVKTNGDKYVTATAPANAVTAIASFYQWAQVSNAQLELSSSVSAYQPYQGISVERTGRNLLQNIATSKTENGITYTVNADGTVTASGTSTALTNLTVGRVFVTVGETYILKATSGGSLSTYKMRAVVRGANGGAINIGGTLFQEAYGGVDRSFTVPSNASYVDVYCNVESGQTISNALYEPMVRLASVTDSTYEPYAGTSYPYSLGQSVYGGTVDLATGVLTVDTVTATINSCSNWTDRISNQNRVYKLATNFLANEPFVYTSVDDLNADGKNRCDRLPIKPTSSGQTTPSVTIGLQTYVYINGVTSISGVTDLASLDTWLSNNPLQITYKLATPITYQLTPTQVSLLTGVNVISTDGNGDMTVTVTEPTLLVNPTLFESKPLLRIYGTGTVNINDKYITISAHSFPYIDIDCELMDAFYGSSNANQYVTFSDNDYITLKSGNNYIAYGNQIEVTPRWYEI